MAVTAVTRARTVTASLKLSLSNEHGEGIVWATHSTTTVPAVTTAARSRTVTTGLQLLTVLSYAQ